MTDAAEKLAASAQDLSPSERLAVVDAILSSLDSPDPEIDRLWAAESEDRLAAYRRGEIRSVTLAEVLDELKKRAP